MCANTRLFYLSPNMSRPLLSCSASPPCPDSHQNIDPSCHRGALQNPQNAPLCFYFSYLSGMRHFPSLFNPFGYSKPDQTSFLDVTSLLSHDNLFPPQKIYPRCHFQHFQYFLREQSKPRPLPPPPSPAQQEITLKQPEALPALPTALQQTCLVLPAQCSVLSAQCYTQRCSRPQKMQPRVLQSSTILLITIIEFLVSICFVRCSLLYI